LPCLQEQPLWIAILGTSTTRGIFFEFVDTILPEQQTVNLTQSKWWKCWGVLDATIGNFRITYRDQRLHYGDEVLSEDYRTMAMHWMYQNICPKHMSSSKGGVDWANLTQAGWKAVPDMIVVESLPVVLEQKNGTSCLAEFEENGGLVVGISHKPRNPAFTNSQVARDHSAQQQSHGRSYLDIFPMARPMYNHRRGDNRVRNIHYVHTGKCFGGDYNHVGNPGDGGVYDVAYPTPEALYLQ